MNEPIPSAIVRLNDIFYWILADQEAIEAGSPSTALSPEKKKATPTLARYGLREGKMWREVPVLSLSEDVPEGRGVRRPLPSHKRKQARLTARSKQWRLFLQAMQSQRQSQPKT